ncbi:MAG: formylglycine-generating enzyme family protein [Planctomycetes bacterium]|nr:formylglycine-generating enzyme family protein [Planctomycetota bacterium]
MVNKKASTKKLKNKTNYKGVNWVRYLWQTKEVVGTPKEDPKYICFSDSNSYPYDTSPTQGFHPTFNDGISPYTAPVGWFAPNAYGLYNMAGNVFEWCNDGYDFGYYLVTPSTNNPKGPISGTVRVHRGGAWVGETYNSKVSYRNFYTPGHRTSYNGFRVVLDLK